MKPKRCGDCERFYIEKETSMSFCVPLKDKYGWEAVEADQEPSVNCPYEEHGTMNLTNKQIEEQETWDLIQKIG